MEPIQTNCVLDEANRFLYVGGDWDGFAEANGGQAAAGAAIGGRPVFDFVQGFETRTFLNAALFAVRDRARPFVSDYRCDGPGIRRFMRMTIAPLRHGRVLMCHDFLHAERAGAEVATLFAPGARARKCSVCCAVEFGDVWLDPFEAGRGHPHHVSYTMCPDCRGRLGVELARMAERTVHPAAGRVLRFASGRAAGAGSAR